MQRCLRQHEVLAAINPSCVNTFRIVTVVDASGSVHLLAHFLRVGVGGDVKDNRATGGLAVSVSEDGKLVGKGLGHRCFAERHPDTGVVFDGIEIPFWEEALDLVREAHRCVPDVKSIGWDVAITPSGPVLVEGNDNWEISGPQDMTGGLRERWAELNG